MDRGRHRALLIAVAGTFVCGGLLHAQTPAGPVPSVAVPPPATPDPAALRKRTVEKAMVERRQRDLAISEQEAQRRIEQLPPEEREAFKRNLRIWRDLSPEEREDVRKDENDRIREEVDKALQQSGLHLDKDQREVFALRYRQERRKLERELQEKVTAERARRLPSLVDGLKREFAERSAAVPTPAVSSPQASPTR